MRPTSRSTSEVAVISSPGVRPSINDLVATGNSLSYRACSRRCRRADGEFLPIAVNSQNLALHFVASWRRFAAAAGEQENERYVEQNTGFSPCQLSGLKPGTSIGSPITFAGRRPASRPSAQSRAIRIRRWLPSG